MARPVMWKEKYKAFVVFKLGLLIMPARVSAPLFLISLSDQTRAAAGECWKVHSGFMLQVELEKSIALSTYQTGTCWKTRILPVFANWSSTRHVWWPSNWLSCALSRLGQWSIHRLSVMPPEWKRSPLALTACAATVALFLGAPTTLCGT